VDGNDEMSGEAEEMCRSVEVLDQRFGHDWVVGCWVFSRPSCVVEVGAEHANGFRLGHIHKSDVCVPCSREEPVPKGGSSTVHSVVVALSNQASVGSCSAR